jgi:pimeloyl-ACP methyl ester carboxylesterase
MTSGNGGPASVFVTAPDGLKLHVRRHGRRGTSALPVVCLPGLARTTADFDELAAALAGRDQGRQVIAVDYRGRGRSEYDPNPDNYNLAVELADLLAVLTALDIGRAVFVGTSRGGILAMLLATARPAAIAGVVLNDIGPVIEPQGLVRIKSYVGKLPPPRNFEEGAEILRRLFDAQFSKLDGEAWLAASRRTWRDHDGRLVPTYDVRLAKTLQSIDLERPLPALWKEFDALGAVPLLAIRGANSDVLSEQTVAAMRERRSAMEAIVVPDQGHAPLLAEPDVIRQIAGFVADCEASNFSKSQRKSHTNIRREF